MTDRGLRSWTDGLSPRERIRGIALTLTQPRSIEWVKEEARVSSREIVKDELEMLVELGQIHVVEGDDENPKFAPNYQRRYLSELAELINTYTRDELRAEIAGIQEIIDGWKTKLDVESREDLKTTLTREGLASDDIRKRTRLLRQWEHCETDKRLLKHAIVLYDDVQSL